MIFIVHTMPDYTVRLKMGSPRAYGQLIFDINGEYANDNPQDGDRSLRSANEARCQVYALTARSGTPSRPLRMNFFEQPAACLEVLGQMLAQDNKMSNYIRSFAGVTLPELADIPGMSTSEKSRAVRKIQMYWAILNKAGFASDATRLRSLNLRATRDIQNFDCHFKEALREAAYASVRAGQPVPPNPTNLDQLQAELDVIAEFRRESPTHPTLQSSDGRPSFDADATALLDFLNPATGSGPTVIRPYREYHAADAGNFQEEILSLLDQGRTVILDLGNATDSIRRYFSNMLSTSVFRAQESKFVGNTMGNQYVQLYFEEAHNLFPPDSKDLTGVYARFAKEGAKFHIGMVYSTQSPSTINKELLAQTENFFVGHLSSQDETKALSRVQIAFSGVEEDILRAKTPGYMRMLTMSHRFVVPTQATKFEARQALIG